MLANAQETANMASKSIEVRMGMIGMVCLFSEGYTEQYVAF